MPEGKLLEEPQSASGGRRSACCWWTLGFQQRGVRPPLLVKSSTPPTHRAQQIHYAPPRRHKYLFCLSYGEFTATLQVQQHTKPQPLEDVLKCVVSWKLVVWMPEAVKPKINLINLNIFKKKCSSWLMQIDWIHLFYCTLKLQRKSNNFCFLCNL